MIAQGTVDWKRWLRESGCKKWVKAMGQTDLLCAFACLAVVDLSLVTVGAGGLSRCTRGERLAAHLVDAVGPPRAVVGQRCNRVGPMLASTSTCMFLSDNFPDHLNDKLCLLFFEAFEGQYSWLHDNTSLKNESCYPSSRMHVTVLQSYGIIFIFLKSIFWVVLTIRETFMVLFESPWTTVMWCILRKIDKFFRF